jgi:hypothetical protein
VVRRTAGLGGRGGFGELRACKGGGSAARGAFELRALKEAGSAAARVEGRLVVDFYNGIGRFEGSGAVPTPRAGA